MGLGSVVRSAVAIADSITGASGAFQATVTHNVWTGESVSNKATRTTTVSRLALVEFEQSRVETSDKQVVQQVAKLTFLRPIAANGAAGRREPIDPRDTFTLPNGWVGRVLAVDGLTDPSTNAPFFCQVRLG